MVMRGVAPSYACPRCGTEAPPTGQRLLTCVTCKLTFDAKVDRPRAAPRRPSEAGEDAPAGIELSADGDSMTLRVPGARMFGLAIAIFAIIVAVAALRVFVGDEAYRTVAVGILAAGALAAVYWGIAQAMGTRVIELDANVLTSRLVPLPLPPSLYVRTRDVAAIEIRRSPHGYGVVAARRDGRASQIISFEMFGANGKEHADYVAGLLSVALARSSRTS